MTDGVLFDFSSTLFHLEPNADWLQGDPRRDDLLALLATSTRSAEHLPAEFAEAWATRDLDPATHRAAYLAVLTTSDLEVEPEVAESLYARMTDPASWRAYPDTGPVLRRLRADGVPVAVVSNIAWDVRDVFARHGVEDLVDEFVLSFAEGVIKPDPKIFTIACQRLGVDPARTVMIGDSAADDGGATAIGCRFVEVAPVNVADRPRALLDALGY